MNRKNDLTSAFVVICLGGLSWQASSAALESAQARRMAPGATTNVDWVKFQDPLEQAFTMDVPQGWSAKGGLFRLGYSDYRAMVDLKSADGKADIRMGDVAIPSYSLPSQYHQREGDPYDLGAQAQMTVARFRSGQDFAVLYARSRFRTLCQSLTPKQSDGYAPIQDNGGQSSVGAIQSSAGEATYQCQGGPEARTAYVYAKTTLYQGLWQVSMLASFVAPAEQVGIARSILLRCSQTLQLAPQWIEYQKQMDEEALVYQRQRQQARIRALSQQVAQFESRMQNMQNQVNAFERGQASQAKQVAGFTNALVGITPTTDPLGNERDVWTGPKSSYWTNSQGQTVNSDTAPGPGWQQLTPKPQERK
jgi:hypothetical protein